MQIGHFGAYGAIAIQYMHIGGGGHFEFDSAAMTAASVLNHDNLLVLHRVSGWH